MCFGDTPEVEAPAPPPEVLTQAAPKKKTAVDDSKTNPLAIGTKKYRTTTGLGTNLGIPKAPSGISV
ncbi:hypothetical protein J1C56_02375 [Aminobacter anthyllidis]|uniref:Uncharacterized protein n=1 Tax=Aminobacter anthyllidis TaxID=1035067 RepID=A0A9X1A7C2_9HYPH|nr:hypothetical protein [Aminobacter anthyllidis]MBT1154430.1 hypothetical protein [Aminobacter anthyllidis]